MECLAFSKRVVRITTFEDIGYLYFSGGQIVHARTRNHLGEEAAMAILGWEEGSFEVVEAPWPDGASIDATWQSLVMRAAQHRDEKPGQVPNLVAFPKSGDSKSKENATSANAESNEDPSMSTELDSVVRLSNEGTTIEAQGPAAEELESLAAYCCQIGALIGEALGLEGFSGLESESKQWRVIVHSTENGMIEAARAPNTLTAARMREILGIKR